MNRKPPYKTQVLAVAQYAIDVYMAQLRLTCPEVKKEHGLNALAFMLRKGRDTGV